MSVTQFTASSGVIIDGVKFQNGTVDVDGTSDGIILDFDGDTTISSPTDDQIDIKIAGSVDFQIKGDTLILSTNSRIEGQNSIIATFFKDNPQQDLTDAGAIQLSNYYTAWTTTTATVATLADSDTPGQLKKIQMVSDGGDGVLTPDNLSGYSTITFDTVGEYVVLCWNGTAWVPIEYGNDNTGTNAGPTLA